MTTVVDTPMLPSHKQALRTSKTKFGRSGYDDDWDNIRPSSTMNNNGNEIEDADLVRSGNNQSLLEEVKGGSETLAAQLARIEAMAEDLEEDFAKTGNDLNYFKKQFDMDFGDNKSKVVSSRLTALEKENMIMKDREQHHNNRGGGSSNSSHKRDAGVKFNIRDNNFGRSHELEAEADLKACWEMIHHIEKTMK